MVQWVCPLCSLTTPAGETHVCPVADRGRSDTQQDPARIEASRNAEKHRNHMRWRERCVDK